MDRNKEKAYKIVSFDISTCATGYAAVELKSNTIKISRSGTIKPKGKLAKDRYLEMARSIRDIVRSESPSVVVVEESFCGKNFPTVKYALKLQGIAEEQAGELGIPFLEFQITSWRSYLGFPNNLDTKKMKARGEEVDFKALSIKKASEYLALFGKEKKSTPEDDNEADAICIGIAQIMRMQDATKGAKKGAKKTRTKKKSREKTQKKTA